MRKLWSWKVYTEAYIYSWVDPRDDNVIYVGSTSDIKSRCRESVYTGKVAEKFAEIRAAGLSPVLKVIETVSKDERFDKEKQWIAKYHLEGHNLCNVKQFNKRGELHVTPRTKAQGVESSHVSFLADSGLKNAIVELAEETGLTVSDLAGRLARIGLNHVDDLWKEL